MTQCVTSDGIGSDIWEYGHGLQLDYRKRIA